MVRAPQPNPAFRLPISPKATLLKPRAGASHGCSSASVPRSEHGASRAQRSGMRGSGDAGGGALVSIANSVSAQRSGDARARRFVRRQQSSRWLVADAISHSDYQLIEGVGYVSASTGEVRESSWVRPPRVARCGWSLGSDVGVFADVANEVAHFSGTERCGSVWSCPSCAAVVRAERAREIEQAVSAHQASGGGVLLVTLTLRHSIEDSLKGLLDCLLGSWRKLLSGRARERLASRFGVEGYLRSVEITYGDHGWHPHIHSLWFVSQPLTDDEATCFGDELHGRWARYAKAATGRMPSREYGVDVRPVDSKGRALAAYLGKLQDEGKRSWSVGAELARGDVKSARGGLVPFELLDVTSDDAGGMSAALRRRLWMEFVTATKGRRAFSWSRGLKARFGVNERTDNQVLNDTERAGELVGVIPVDAYNRLLRTEPSTLSALLTLASRGQFWALQAALADDWHQPAKPLSTRPKGEPRHLVLHF